jgi:hypothetical protein
MTKHPWEDPNLMELYHIQLETNNLIVSYEVATSEYNAVEVATAHLRERLVNPDVRIGVGGSSTIGYHQKGEPKVVKWHLATGPRELLTELPPEGDK